ncbi:MAG: FAD-dependent oxidoreductase [Candidatus Heimdallarchaeota archaeon]|nr:FAD-dependent oxidoreductase [Candidatus Heimdallarchaeota archaeon]
MVKITAFYGTTWCSDCKRSKKFLGEHRILYDFIDIEEDETAALKVEALNNGKRKVPTIVFDDGTFLVEPSNAELAAKLGLISKPKHNFHDVIIIGGGPAGLICGLYTSREGIHTALIEKGALGGQIGVTERLDNFPGFPEGISGEELANRMAKQGKRFGVEFITATEVTGVRREKACLIVETNFGDEYDAKAVVIATGSKYKRLNVPGEKALLGYKIHFCSTCDGPFYKGKELVVIGGGNSAFEESLFLAKFASKVTIVGRSDRWKASAIVLEKVQETKNIVLLTNLVAKEFLVGPKKTLKGIVFYDKKRNEDVILHPAGAFVFIGMKPNSEIVKDLVELDAGGFIKTDATMMTKTKGLFAAGDCRSGSIQQAAYAAGEGAAVALMVRNYLQKH